jgi:hypothetical protein
MKFKSQPNLFVRISNKYVQRVTGIKGFHFDDKGEYETDNELLIKLLSQNFEIVQEENKEENSVTGDKPAIICKKCGKDFESKGLYLAHCRKEHKKEEK